MRRHQKYQLPGSRKHRGGGFFWLAALAILVVIIWVCWQTGKSKAPPVKLIPPVVTVPAHPQPAKPVSPAQQLPQAKAPAVQPGIFPRPVRDTFEAQLALARFGISAGSLDGVNGPQTRAAILAFQRRNGLPETLGLDAATRERLLLTAPPFTTYIVTSNDLARLQPLGKTWLEKSQQTALDYETILELVAEKSHSHPNFIRRLNPGFDWTNVVAGAEVQIPDAAYPEPRDKAAFIVISLGEKKL